jgi:flagellar biosynthetic protein FlhB
MADDSAQERTEEPTARRLQKAREEGRVARSVELPAAVVVIGSFLLLMVSGGWLMRRLADVFAAGFSFDLRTLAQPLGLPTVFARQLLDAFVLFAPLLALTMVLAVLASGLTGGFLFSLKPIEPKGSKIDPLQGFKRIFGAHAAVELGKALLKFVVVSLVLWWTLVSEFETLMNVGRMSLEPALELAGRLIAQLSLFVALSLAVIAMIDVPWQRWQYLRQMRMTRQEIRDELKDIEGRPEVRAQLRRRQREIANARMIQRVRDADVVITNPEHFAVALEYDPTGDAPPTVVALGIDFLAQRIREEAQVRGVEIFEAPPLARALYFTTEVDQPIPEELYHAVAQVIAYVFSLQGGRPGTAAQRPRPQVPESMVFDADGRRAGEGVAGAEG